ncbi:hypothetical protein GI374_04650 [Paracoccus sp. S-4012]|uniref:hypothetical protein n=1 Tax=Paracoccus sp. S-4012 TaxID=2665648 RepID=UPI0012B13606|nr:hypothetical protein [Paracoccus sp. S-4012]MRX49750.1 hypothetical protein [Paracoccus sp. S-4012]
MGRLGDRLSDWRARAAEDRAAAVGLAVSVAWLVLVVMFWALGPEGSPQGGAAQLATAVGVLMPLALIWLAVGTARALAGLREEAHSLRAELLALRGGASRSHEVQDDLPPPPVRMTEPAPRSATPRPAPARAAAPRRGEAPPQPSLDLGGPAAVEVLPEDLIAGLNFPDGPDDRAAIDAMRRALMDGETARLIRASQDAVTLLAARGLYMDDLPAPDTPAAAWRRFAEGQRGAALGPAPELLDADEAVTLADLLRGDEVFRDAAHHFMRHWDRMLTRTLPRLDDVQLRRLAGTRSGRAFVVLAQATGSFG